MVNKKIQNEQMVFHYKKKKDHTFPYKKMSIDDIRKEFYLRLFSSIYNNILKSHTITSLIAFIGQNNISEVLYECAI